MKSTRTTPGRADGAATVKSAIAKLETVRDEIQAQALEGFSVEAQLGAARAVLRDPNNQYLRQAVAEAPDEFVGAVLELSRMGITLHPSQRLAYLVPYRQRDKNGNAIGWTINPTISARGYIAIYKRAGDIRDATARVLYERDRFDAVSSWEAGRGDTSNLTHEPAIGDRGKAVGAYAVVVLPEGTFKWLYLAEERIKRRHRDVSKVPDSTAWRVHWESMWGKSALKELFGELPLSLHVPDYDVESPQAFRASVVEPTTIELPHDPPLGLEIGDGIQSTLADEAGNARTVSARNFESELAEDLARIQ